MKKIIIAAVFLIAGVANAQSGGTINTLDQFTSTSTPSSAITQRTWGKALKITGLTTGLCLTLNANNFLTTTACGTGTPGGSSGQVQYNGSGSFAGVATSTFSAGTNVTFTGTPGYLIGGTNLTINATGGSGTFAWTPQSWGNSTSTTLGFLNGFISTASSTINAILRGKDAIFSSYIDAPYFVATSTTATSTFAGGVTNYNGDIFTNQATYIVSTSTKNGHFTSINSALAALPSGGGKVFVRAGTYAITSGISIPKSKVILEGEGDATLIRCDGSVVGLCMSIATSSALSEITIRDLRIQQTNATAQGVGLDVSDTAIVRVDNVRIDEFNTGILYQDTVSNSFYSSFKNLTLTNNNTCFKTGGTQANNNSLDSVRCRPKAGGAGVGLSLIDSRGWTVTSFDAEPTTGTGITGINIDATSREITLINPWIENNATGLNIESGANRVVVVGGSITSNTTDITDNGTSSVFVGTSRTGALRNYSSGAFGIGTTSPYAKLSVAGETVASHFTATTTATSTLPRLETAGLNLTNFLTFNGVTGSTWASFCTTITGSADLCDGSDASGVGGTGLSTTSPIAGSNVLVYSAAGAGAAYGAATTTFTATGVLTLSQPISVLGSSASALTLTGGSPGQVLGWLSGVPTWTASSSVAAGTGISVSASGAVTTVTNTGVISGLCTWPQICSGTNPLTITWGGLATSSAISAASGLLYATGVNTLASISTSTAVNMSITGNAATVTTNANLSGVVTSVGNTTSYGSQAAGVLGNAATGNTAPMATSTLYGVAPAGGYVLGWNNVTSGIGWIATSTGGGSGTPGGSDTQLQFNDGGAFGGAVGFVWKKLTGLLGIGTTTPSIGVMTIASSTAPQFSWSAGAGVAQWVSRNAGGNLYFATTTVAGTATTTTSALTLSGSGKPGLAIGSSTPAATLAVMTIPADFSNQFLVGSSTATSFQIDNNGSIFAPKTLTSGASQTGYWCYDTNGQLIRDSAVCIVSARKFKKDILPLNVGLSDLLKLQPVSYYYKDATFGAGKMMGFIADDTPNSLNEMLVTKDSNGDVHGFRYDQLTSLIVKSIQQIYQKVLDLVAWNYEQDESLKRLEAENNELRHRIEVLESKL